MAACKGTSCEASLVTWDVVSPIGPALAHHAGCIIGNTLYVHGGVDKTGSANPLNKLHCLDLEGRIWQEIREPHSPSLSHHASVVLQDRYMVLIGGWNGHERTSAVFAFDTLERRWLSPRSNGFSVGAGLSSHTAVVGENGDILVIGREGSLRLQRRAGNAFLLQGDIKKGVFRYTDFPLGVESRSGHTTHIIGSTLISYGGRSDKPIEMHAGYKSGMKSASIMLRLVKKVEEMKPLMKIPGGRKHHVSCSGASAVFIHGGETFDGRREPVGDMYLLLTKPHHSWYKLGDSKLGRSGHVCGVSEHRVVIHGGQGAKGLIHGDSYMLTV